MTTFLVLLFHSILIYFLVCPAVFFLRVLIWLAFIFLLCQLWLPSLFNRYSKSFLSFSLCFFFSSSCYIHAFLHDIYFLSTDIQLMLGGIGVMIIAQLIGLSYGRVPQYGRYLTSVVLMYAVGYPIGHTAVLGAFSKIQKSGIAHCTEKSNIFNIIGE